MDSGRLIESLFSLEESLHVKSMELLIVICVSKINGKIAPTSLITGFLNACYGKYHTIEFWFHIPIV